MASSGTITGSITGNFSKWVNCWIAWQINSQNAVNNTSNITVNLNIQAKAGSNVYTYNRNHKPTATMSVNGSSVTPTVDYLDLYKNSIKYQVCTIATWTGNVQHNSSGASIAIPISASFTSYNDGVTSVNISGGYASGTATLNAIPKASTMIITQSGSVLRVGESYTLWVSRPSASYSDVITCSINGNSVSVATLPVGTASTTCTFSDACNAYFTASSQTASATFTCSTYSGSTLVGTSTLIKTLYIGASAAPAVTAAYTLVDGYSGSYLKSKSQVQATPTVTTQYSATVSSYTLTVGSKIKTSGSSPITSDIITESGELTVTVMVTDSRGMTGSTSTTISVLDYYAPQILPNGGSTVLVARCDSSGNLSNIGECLYVQALASCAGITGNSCTFSYAVKAVSDPSYPADTSLGATAVDGKVSSVSLNASTAYSVKLTATDTVGTTTYYYATISETIPAFHLKAGGKGAAFGRRSTTNNLLDIAWDVRIRGNLQVDGDGAAGTFFEADGSQSTSYVTLQNGKNVSDIITAFGTGKPVYITVPDNHRLFTVTYAYNGSVVALSMYSNQLERLYGATGGATALSWQRCTLSFS